MVKNFDEGELLKREDVPKFRRQKSYVEKWRITVPL